MCIYQPTVNIHSLNLESQARQINPSQSLELLYLSTPLNLPHPLPPFLSPPYQDPYRYIANPQKTREKEPSPKIPNTFRQRQSKIPYRKR